MKRLIPVIVFMLGIFSTDLTAQVDYSADIQPIFNANCTSCHGGQSGVTLSSYSATMNSVGTQYDTLIVVPGDPEQSPLVDKIEPDPQFGSQMPQGGSLSDSEIKLIKDWIEQGANEVATSNEVIAKLPEGFKLNGNYPNPFNPTTTISFEVPETISYQVKVFSAVGAQINEVAGSSNAGTVSLKLNLDNQPSGVYFYQVFAVKSNQKYLLGSEKMTLVK